MKVLMISSLPLWSMGEGKGAASFARTLQGLLDHGAHVHLVHGCQADGKLPAGVTHSSFAMPWLQRLSMVRGFSFVSHAAWWFLFFCWAILEGASHLQRYGADCIYGYEIHGAPVAAVLGWLFRKRSVGRFQGTILAPHIDSWSKRIYYWNHIVALTSPLDLVIMANDGTEGDMVLRRLGVPAERTRFWMNGVQVLRDEAGTREADPRITSFKAGGGRVLMTVSRLIGWKRVDRIISSMPKILKGEPNTMLVVLGDGPMWRAYEALAVSLGVSPNVLFVGAVPQAFIPAYLLEADIFVSMFDLSNLGNPLLEAMSMERCVVTLNNGGTNSVVTNRVNGVLLEPCDAAYLPEVILELLKDDALRHRIGAEAGAFARKTFRTWSERMDMEYQEISALLAKRSP